MEFMIQQASLKKPPENPNSMEFRELPSWRMHLYQEVRLSNLTGIEDPELRDLPDLALCVCSSLLHPLVNW